jgi:Zn-dependent M16 (insulinase) family peptidase
MKYHIASFVLHATIGPQSFNDLDIAALRVLDEYLTTMEGPFWKQVRGAGLAYGSNLRLNIEHGLLYFVVYRSPDGYRAFHVVRQIIDDFANERIPFDQTFLDAAKSGVLFSIVSREDTVSAAASESFMNQDLLRAVQAVQLEDLRAVLKRYLVPLFQSRSSCGAVTVAPGKLDDLSQGFRSLGFLVKKSTVVEDDFNETQ